MRYLPTRHQFSYHCINCNYLYLKVSFCSGSTSLLGVNDIYTYASLSLAQTSRQIVHQHQSSFSQNAFDFLNYIFLLRYCIKTKTIVVMAVYHSSRRNNCAGLKSHNEATSQNNHHKLCKYSDLYNCMQLLHLQDLNA